MSTPIVERDASAADMSTDAETLRVVLADGRELSAPLMGFPRLSSPRPPSSAPSGVSWATA
jgi:hypothetical protein